MVTWAQTLANGNQTGGNNPTIDAGDSLLFDGVREQPTATILVDESIATAPVLDVTGANYLGTTGSVSTSLRFQTGEAEANVPGAGPASGLVQIITGQTIDGAGNAGPSGAVQISTGAALSVAGSDPSGQVLLATGATSGGSRRSGNISLLTGSGLSSGRTGDALVRTGAQGGTGDSGNVTLETGANNGTGDTGEVNLITGNAPSGLSGAIGLTTGNADTAGPILIGPGTTNGAGSGAQVALTGGYASVGVGGNVRITSGDGVSGRGQIELGAPDSFGAVGTLAEEVLAQLTEWEVDNFIQPASRSTWRKKITVDVAAVPATIADDPDFEYQNNFAGTSLGSTTEGMTLIQATGSAGDYSVVRTDQTAGVSSWGKVQLSRTSRYVISGTVSMSILAGRYEVGARPTTNAFDDTTDDNKTILVYDPTVGPNWRAVTSNNGVDQSDDTGIPAAGAPLNYMIRINTSNQVEYWLSDPTRGGRLVLTVVRSVGVGLANNVYYAGCICNVPATTPEFRWGNPAISANI